MKETTVRKIVMAGVGIILALFFAYGLIIKQKCDIDAVFLWCRLHPFSAGDLIGVSLFTACALYIGGFLKLFGFDPWGTGAKWNVIAGIAGALGIILFWNL